MPQASSQQAYVMINIIYIGQVCVFAIFLPFKPDYYKKNIIYEAQTRVCRHNNNVIFSSMIFLE